MTTIQATVVGRRLELDVPVDWPDGTQVEIHPISQRAQDEDAIPPDEIPVLLAAMDRMEPLELTDSEYAAWETERQARRKSEKEHFAQHAEKLRGMWD